MNKSPKKSAKPKLNFEMLSTEWSHTDGEGYVRIIPIDSYKTGFVAMAHIGPLAEQLQYYPEITLCGDKVIIKIDDADQQTALQLARQIDDVFHVDDSEQ